MGGRLSPEERFQVRNLRRTGRSVRRIARQLTVSESTVKRYSRPGQPVIDRRSVRGQGRKHLIPDEHLEEFAGIVFRQNNLENASTRL